MKQNDEVNKKELQPAPVAKAPPVMDAAPPETSPAAETTSDNPSPSKIDAIIKSFMPDVDLSTPEAREAAIEQLLTRLSDIHNSLMDVVDDEPEFGMVLNDILKGSKVAIAFARHYGPEAFSEPAEGEPDYEEYGKYKQERIEKRKKKQERMNALKSNEEVSIKEIEAYMEEKGLTPEQAQDFFAKADNFFKDVFDGKITKDHLSMLERAFGYESAVKEAEENGRVIGRNEKIIEQKVKKPVTSGLPEINEGGVPPKPKARNRGLLDELYGS
jgi:hypothetical protein